MNHLDMGHFPARNLLNHQRTFCKGPWHNIFRTKRSISCGSAPSRLARCDGCVLGAGPAGSEWSSLRRFGPSGLGVGLQQITAVITWEKLEHRKLQKKTWRFSIFGIAASTSLKLCLPWVGPFDHDIFTINPTVSLVNHTFQPLQYNVIHQLCQRQPEIDKPWLIFTILDPKNRDRILDFSWNREFWEFHIDYIHWKSKISLFQLHHTMAIFWPSLGASPQL